jgi:hypothetical protein
MLHGYALQMDVPRVARLVPGVSHVGPPGADRHGARSSFAWARSGSLSRAIIAIVARQPAGPQRCAPRGERRVGLRATLTMALVDPNGGTDRASQATCRSRTARRARSAVIERKVDELMREFVTNLERELAS